MPEVEILKFYEGACTPKDFANVICEHLARFAGDETHTDLTQVQSICWKIYSEVCEAQRV